MSVCLVVCRVGKRGVRVYVWVMAVMVILAVVAGQLQRCNPQPSLHPRDTGGDVEPPLTNCLLLLLHVCVPVCDTVCVAMTTGTRTGACPSAMSATLTAWRRECCAPTSLRLRSTTCQLGERVGWLTWWVGCGWVGVRCATTAMHALREWQWCARSVETAAGAAVLQQLNSRRRHRVCCLC